FLVGCRLQRCRRPCPRRGGGCERLCCRDILTVNVSDGGRFTIVRVVSVLHIIDPRPLRPHRAHWNFVEFLHFHSVSHKSPSALVRFAVVPHAAFVQCLLQLPIVLVRNQVRDGLAEVPE